ncbi:MAG: hypothetical protein R3E08_00030 [Thiotrichaceae bacterium]
MLRIFRWLQFTFVLLVGVSIAILMWGILEPNLIVIKQVNLAVLRWRPAHAHFKIAVLSDIHVSAPHISLEKLHHIVEMTNAQQPDLTLLLGDYMIGNMRIGGKLIKPELIATELQLLRSIRCDSNLGQSRMVVRWLASVAGVGASWH